MIVTNVIITIVVLFVFAFLLYKIKSKNQYIWETEQYYEQRIKMLTKNSTDEKKKMQTQIDGTQLLFESERRKSEKLQEKLFNTKCLICNNFSNGKHYCISCYTKYKERSIDVRITNCLHTKIIDNYGNKSFMGGDGRMFRSRAEALISHFLFDNSIRYIYEKPIYYVENGLSKTLHPDFYLPDYNLYIEYNELSQYDYANSKAYAMNIYRQKGLKVIVMTNRELADIANFLMPKLFSKQ